MTTINSGAASAAGRETAIHNDDMTAPRKPLGLYLHIPFCIRKCNYCDFLSFGGVQEEEQKAYFHALAREIRYYGKIYNNKYYVDTIFIGGGTPSLVEEGLIDWLMTAVRESFVVVEDAEISIESNPKTLTDRKLNAYLESGINRISIGVQSFDDGLLNDMGRVHNAEDFFKNYSAARECGFRNINIDLMFAIPGQTLKIWKDTLERAIGLAPEHISFYSLQLEEGTPFFSMFQEGSLKQVDDELDRAMYHTAVGMLSDAGYGHYEISNAAKAGFQCRHNLKYWSMDDSLGLGLGAHSFMDGTRASNVTDLEEYIRAGLAESSGAGREADDMSGSPFIQQRHRNTREDDISEYLFTGLRKIRGIYLPDFQRRFGVSLDTIHGRTLEKYLAGRLLEMQDGWLRFTEKGIDISNTVLAEFV